jgi:hypothetical protein
MYTPMPTSTPGGPAAMLMMLAERAALINGAAAAKSGGVMPGGYPNHYMMNVSFQHRPALFALSNTRQGPQPFLDLLALLTAHFTTLVCVFPQCLACVFVVPTSLPRPPAVH